MTIIAGMARLAVPVAIGLLICGCTGPGPVPPAEIATTVTCTNPIQVPGAPSAAPTPTEGRVPGGFRPVAAIRCPIWPILEGDRPPAPERLEGDLGPLLAALAEPDDPPRPGPCPAIGQLVPELWLVDSRDRGIRVHYPRDGCGLVKPAVGKALAKLTVVG